MDTPIPGNLSTSSTAKVMHFCGHIISKDETGRFPKSHEAIIQPAIDNYFIENNIGTAFGSLAAGADIMIAESLLKRKAELHLIFPYPIESFVKNSVLPSGVSWLNRFNSVLKKARSVTIVYRQQPKDEILSYAQCTEVAMGLVLLSAAHSVSSKRAKQLTLWDEKLTDGIAGTYPDMLRWNSLGLESFYFGTKFEQNKGLEVYPLPLAKFTNKEKQQSKNLPPTLAAYQAHKRLVSINTPLDFFAKNRTLSDPKSTTWDLDHNVFGSTTDNSKPFITTRCAAMLAFHLIKNSQNIDSKLMLKKLSSINTMRFKG